MVSADNLNFDCLELIFAYLSGNDLVAVSLVSRSFLAAAIPRLYRRLFFGLNQAKRYPSIISPFAAILEHPNLASHVRYIDIRAIPTMKFAPHPKFLHDCSRTLSLCKNLGSFTCTLDVMPAFLLSLQAKDGLESMRFIGNLTTDQAEQLVQISGLREVTVDTSSWNVVNVLPRWLETLRPTLMSLTLYSIQSLNVEILETVLPNLPNLTRLHVVGCPKVDHTAVLRLLSHTPNLESLAFTCYESSRPLPPVIPPLSCLRHLALDAHYAPTPTTSTPTFWTTMIDLTRTWSCPLKSLTLRLSDKIALADSFVTNLVDSHHATLSHLVILNCTLTDQSILKICQDCTELERIALSLTSKNSGAFASAVKKAKRLHTITEVGDLHSSHTPHAPLTKDDIRIIMSNQPSIEKIIADGRVWTVRITLLYAPPCSIAQ
ncbi:hypothetical protein BV20DRAFT_1062018 [Pilatotrama ljubarskyi]|nr:hypothetical protein BV20DRAFT_1062018 [Pilatotrama ljubarskyi]